MTNSKSTKRALLTSALAMLMCVAMLIGTTFAWFTDTASTAVNKIQSGTLDVALEMNTGTTAEPNWVSAEGETLQFKVNGQIPEEGTQILWEPGCTYELPELRVVNKGNLALKYKVIITGIQGNAKLNEVIDWTINNEAIDLQETKLAANTEGVAFTIKGHMQETAGNEYQNLSIDGISITVVATQDTVESDSYDNQYDKNAVLPVSASAKGNLTVTKNADAANAVVATSQTLSDSVMSVTYPDGVKLKSDTTVEGTTDKKASVAQALEYVDDAPSSAMNNVTIDADKAVASYELTLPVADDNNVLVTATINYAKGLSGVQIYHTGVLLPSSSENGEYATYDSSTGVITLHLFKASPIDIVYDKPGTATVTTADELEAAINDESVNLIKLGQDINLTTVLDVTHSVTIDFCGKSINASGEKVKDMQNAINIVNDPTSSNKLTFKDSIGGGKFHSTYGGVTLRSSKAQFELNDVTMSSDKGFVVEISSYTIKLDGSYDLAGFGDLSNASVVINSGKIVTPANDGSSNGAIHGGSNAYASGEKNTVVINGGEIEIGNVYCGIYLAQWSRLTINGGTFTSKNGESIIYIANPDAKATISDGSFTVANASKAIFSYIVSVGSNGDADAVTVNNGTFTVNGTSVTNK